MYCKSSFLVISDYFYFEACCNRSQILHFKFVVQLYFELVDVLLVRADNNQVIHIDDYYHVRVDVYCVVGVRSLETVVE